MTCKHTINKHVTRNLQQKKERSGTGSIDPRAPTKSHPTLGGGGGGGWTPTHPEILPDPPTHLSPPRGRVGRTQSKTLVIALFFAPDVNVQRDNVFQAKACSILLSGGLPDLRCCRRPPRTASAVWWVGHDVGKPHWLSSSARLDLSLSSPPHRAMRLVYRTRSHLVVS